MEPPSLIELKETLKSEKTYKIVSDKNNSFSIIFKNLDSCIEIYAYYQDEILKHFYNNKFTLDSLKKNNRYFSLFESIDEVYNDLIILLDKNQTKILEDKNFISISIPMESLKIKELLFVINKLEKNDNEKMQEIFSLILEMKTEIKKLNENKNLKEEIKNLKEDNKNLKEEIKNLKEENKNLKKRLDVYIPYLEEYKKKSDNKKQNKIINLDSKIINENEKYNITLKNWINPNLKIKAQLLYRLSRDGEEYSTFHQLCDDKGPTIVLAKLTDGNILGLYTPLDWETRTNNWKSDPNIFVFSLTEMKKQTGNYGIYCHKDYGPHSYFLEFCSGHKMKEPYLYMDDKEYQILAPGKQSNYYKADEVEVFKIIIG
jgi:hypothetical protein